MTDEQLLEIIERNKECVLQSQEACCNSRCQRCYYHNSDYIMIDAYNDIITILKERINKQ